VKGNIDRFPATQFEEFRRHEHRSKATLGDGTKYLRINAL
jgi:hypothetical protein